MSARDLGKRPELKWLPVGKLKADPRYQRTIETRRGQALIERIGAAFHWSAFQAILAMPDGEGAWLVLDGQHRVEAARRVKVTEVPAVVVASVSLEEQAAAFVQANRDRVAVTPYALHHANLIAGDTGAAAIDRVCRKAGVSIPRYPGPADKLKPGDTLALGTIGALIKHHGEALAGLAIAAVAAGHRSRRGELRAPTFKAAAAILAVAPAAERPVRAKAITSALARSAPAALEAAAVRRRAETGGTHEKAVETVLRELLDAVPAPAAAPPPPVTVGLGPRPASAISRAAEIDEDKAIAEHVAKKGVTRAPALDVDTVLNEVRRSGDNVVPTDARFISFKINGSITTDRGGLVTRANRMRAKRGEKPWTAEEIRWTRPEPEAPQSFRAGTSALFRKRASAG